ncbi:MAG: carboxyl transferase domain-containing protein [Pseudomonadota bacterium]
MPVVRGSASTMGKRLLIANRGEIAVRIIRAAQDLELEAIALYSQDDAGSQHRYLADDAIALEALGPKAYLDIDAVITAAREHHCAMLHPGYGLLSENAELAAACAANGITFVGPKAQTLAQCGDKAMMRTLAQTNGVPVMPGIDCAAELPAVADFFEQHGSDHGILIKALAGGGGRGMRHVTAQADIEDAFTACQREAMSSFGIGDVYVEQYLPFARHIEVQIIGDGEHAIHLGERECTLQRRHQKLVEIAPSPNLPAAIREQLVTYAEHLANALEYQSLGTFEFLVATDTQGAMDDDAQIAFIEANARLQVEHTVTEAVTNLDLVALQLEIASGKSLDDLNLTEESHRPLGTAIQLRVCTEIMTAEGEIRPQGGTLSRFDPPTGIGVRTDTHGYSGYTTNPNFDSLLAKVIVTSRQGFEHALGRSYRALCEFQIDGVKSNLEFLQNLIAHDAVQSDQVFTKFIESNLGALVANTAHPQRAAATTPSAPHAELAGAKVDADDPLAVLAFGKQDNGTGEDMLQADANTVCAPMQGTIIAVDVGAGDPVKAGHALLLMEAMKMEHVIAAHIDGVIDAIDVAVGDSVFEGHPLIHIEPQEIEAQASPEDKALDLDHVRDDLQEVFERRGVGLDENRPKSVERRRKTGQRTARENIEDLCDPETFVEYAPLAVAAQRQRRSTEELIEKTPGDGMVTGLGQVNGDLFDAETARCVLMTYDYTVLAGTQGWQNHRKKDRMFEIAERSHLPIVIFTEGGGGRPGETDGLSPVGLDCLAFYLFGKLSGSVPLVGITTGRCFAGNAALLGCCDVVIATAGANIGMGGPAMIEGGGLGVFRPEEVGPVDVQEPNGVIDILVADEAEAVTVAKQYLSYFQGAVTNWECPDQRALRSVIPENRLRVYDVREVIDLLADTDSVLELRPRFGLGMVTAFMRVEGRPLGVIANNPTHLAGAIDTEGADKAARFMQLCDAFDIPLLFLCDCPGIMVGPESEKSALVRHAARMFVTGANVDVPFFTIILRKGYGLGAQAMAGGSFKATNFTVAWPTGEFGGMGLEGFVKLGYRDELAAIEDTQARKERYEEMVAGLYAQGKAVNMASHFEFDDVIDPAESRQWITAALEAAPKPQRSGKKRPNIDTW